MMGLDLASRSLAPREGTRRAISSSTTLPQMPICSLAARNVSRSAGVAA